MRRHYRRELSGAKLIKSHASESDGATPDIAQAVIQSSAMAALVWSTLSFTFAIGHIFRIDPSVLNIISISDVLSISFSYLIYLFPILVMLAALPMQFFIPAPTRQNDVQFLPTYVMTRLPRSVFVAALFLVAAAIPLVLPLDTRLHFLDRSSLLYKVIDIVVVSLSTFLALCGYSILIATKNKEQNKVLGYGASVSLILIFYLAGDYVSSLRMNKPKAMDCAVLYGSDRCYPVLLWGHDFFITWSGEKIRAIKSDKVEHLWLHPHKRPDVRVLP